ncbi:MAG: RAD55 family ATPase, partial [Candidatus Ranarchaeia archaeon]
VSLEESTSSLIENLSAFEWILGELIESGKIVVIDASPTRSSKKGESRYVIPVEHPVFSEREFSVDSIVSLIHSSRRKIGAKRLVIDCITNLLLQYDSAFNARQDIVTLLKSFKKSKLTTLLTAEYYPERPYYIASIEPFLVDGVINLSLLRHGNTKIRSLELMKMRGMKHSMDSALVRITRKGIEAYPSEPVFSEDTREKIW